MKKYLKIVKKHYTKCQSYFKRLKAFTQRTLEKFAFSLHALTIQGRYYTGIFISIIFLTLLIIIFKAPGTIFVLGIILLIFLLLKITFYHYIQLSLTPKIIIRKHAFLPWTQRSKWSDLKQIRTQSIFDRILTLSIQKEIIFSFEVPIAKTIVNMRFNPVIYNFLPMLNAALKYLTDRQHPDREVLEKFLTDRQNIMHLFQQTFSKKKRRISRL